MLLSVAGEDIQQGNEIKTAVKVSLYISLIWVVNFVGIYLGTLYFYILFLICLNFIYTINTFDLKNMYLPTYNISYLYKPTPINLYEYG